VGNVVGKHGPTNDVRLTSVTVPAPPDRPVYHDPASEVPHAGEIEVTDDASLAKQITELEKEMRASAKRLEFEQAVRLRDRIKELRPQQIYKT
jgi:excinuclease UvrABC helicase subunit UvrB